MKSVRLLALLVALAAGVGCGQPDSAPESHENGVGDSAADNHGHDHPDGDSGDHSVEGHAHGVGPHGGTIADWGGGAYHVEFTVDHDTQTATVYLLGRDEKSPAPIDADSIELSITDPEMQVVLQAEPQGGDPEGKASRFVGTNEKLGVVQAYAGTITGVAEGTPYSGDFREESHADHDH